MPKEADIKHQRGDFFVLEVREKPARYEVCASGLTHAQVDSAYSHDAAGLSLAVARCDYLAKVKKQAPLVVLPAWQFSHKQPDPPHVAREVIRQTYGSRL